MRPSPARRLELRQADRGERLELAGTVSRRQQQVAAVDASWTLNDRFGSACRRERPRVVIRRVRFDAGEPTSDLPLAPAVPPIARKAAAPQALPMGASLLAQRMRTTFCVLPMKVDGRREPAHKLAHGCKELRGIGQEAQADRRVPAGVHSCSGCNWNRLVDRRQRASQDVVHGRNHARLRRPFRWLLKVQLDEVAAYKRKREDAASFVTNVLTDLKGVFDQVAQARILIPAHQSVATYGDEMRALITARVNFAT
jgi:hypothetical protein